MSILQLNNNSESQEQWHQALDFFSGFNGLNRAVIDSGRVYQEYPVMTEMLRISDKISYSPEHSLLAADAESATIPAPAYLLSLLLSEHEWKQHYASADDMAADVAAAYTSLLSEAYASGLKNITFIDFAWLPLMDATQYNLLIQGGVDVEEYMNLLIKANNLVIEGLPQGIYVTQYVGTGGYTSAGFNACYSQIAPALFPATKANAISLDFWIDGDYNFTALSLVPDDKPVELCYALNGLSEPPASLLEMVAARAAQYHPASLVSIVLRQSVPAIAEA